MHYNILKIIILKFTQLYIEEELIFDKKKKKI